MAYHKEQHKHSNYEHAAEWIHTKAGIDEGKWLEGDENEIKNLLGENSQAYADLKEVIKSQKFKDAFEDEVGSIAKSNKTEKVNNKIRDAGTEKELKEIEKEIQNDSRLEIDDFTEVFKNKRDAFEQERIEEDRETWKEEVKEEREKISKQEERRKIFNQRAKELTPERFKQLPYRTAKTFGEYYQLDPTEAERIFNELKQQSNQ